MPGLKPALELLEENPDRIAKIYCRKSRQGSEIEKLKALCQKQLITFELVDDANFSSFCKDSPQTAHQGILTLLADYPPIALDSLLAQAVAAPLPLLIALDQVQDPGNLGTICRTAWALGCAGLILPKHNSALIGPAAFKASAGAIVRLPVCIATNLARALDQAEEAGFAIYGAALAENCANAFHFEWQLPGVLVLGSEEHGIRPGVAKRCHAMLAIPFKRAFDSLNVAQAGAILMALCAKQTDVLPTLTAKRQNRIGEIAG